MSHVLNYWLEKRVKFFDSGRAFVGVLLLAFVCVLPGVSVSADEFCRQAAYEAAPAGPHIGLVPHEITRPVDVAAFLSWVRENIPELYWNTKDFPVDFWEVVREQNHLQDLFQQFTEYREYLKKKTSLVTMTIQNQQSGANAFDLNGFVAEASAEAARFTTTDDLKTALARQLSSQGNGSARGMLNDLFALVAKSDMGWVRRNMTIDALLAYFSSHGGIPANFRGTAYGLVAPWNAANVRTRFVELSRSQDRADQLRRTLFFKENESKFKNDPAGAAKLVESAPKGDLKNALNAFRSKGEAAAQAGNKVVNLVLREISDALALWKKCVGIECTPPRFAMLPGERAFLVYDGKDLKNPKGYLSAAIVKDEAGNETLFLKQFQGPRISPADVENILSKAPELAKAMGAVRVLINGTPHSNYNDLWAPWQKFADRARGQVPFLYYDSDMRKLMDIEPNDLGGVHHSEAMVKNSEAYPLKVDESQAARLAAAATVQNIEPVALPNLAPIDRLEAAISFGRFMSNKSQGEIANVFTQLGVRREDIAGIVDLVKDPKKYTDAEFKARLIELARTEDGPMDPDFVLQRLGYLIEANKMRFKDAFAPENEAKSVTALVQKVRGTRNMLDWMFENFIYVDGRPIPLLKEKIIQLIRDADEPDDLRIVYLLIMMLKEEHLNGSYSLRLVQEIESKVPKFKSFLSPEKTNEDLKKTNFYQSMNRLYKYQPQAVLKAVEKSEFQWKLAYYLNFSAEIRDQFRGFRDGALWNLKNEGGDPHRWWFVTAGVVDINEFNKVIIAGDFNLVGQFTSLAKKQFLKKLTDYCGGAQVAACAGFMNRVHEARSSGVPDENSQFVQIMTEFLKQL